MQLLFLMAKLVLMFIELNIFWDIEMLVKFNWKFITLVVLWMTCAQANLQAGTNNCISKQTCHECIQTELCAWCIKVVSIIYI